MTKQVNGFFNLARFMRLFRAHWAENKKEYGWFFIVLAGVNFLLLSATLSVQNTSSLSSFRHDFQVFWYFSGLIVTGCIFASRYFRQLTNSGYALIQLMRPASIFEKMLLAIFIVSVFYPLVYTVIYALMNYPAVQIAKMIYVPYENATENIVQMGYFDFYFPFLTTSTFNPKEQFLMALQAYFFVLLWILQALLLGSSVYFKKAPILRTFVFLFVFFLVIFWAGFRAEIGTFWSGQPILHDNAVEHWISLIVWLGLPILLWVTLFFNLKEREVA